MKDLLLYAIAIAIPSVCCLLSSWRKTAAIERTAERYLKDCPPEKRARMLRALAEFTGQLCAERFPSALTGVLLRRRPGRE